MKSILFADNDRDFLNTRAEFLEMAGYRVIKAATLSDAERCLSETWSPLAILDIRLVDDDDEKDLSGLSLARMEACYAVAKIMLSGYLTHDVVRELLRIQMSGQRLAVNVLAKEEGPEALIEAVNHAFTHHVRINWDLNIHWSDREPLSLPHLVTLIEPEIDRARLPDRTGEMEDLFRKLFYDYDQITLSRLLWHKGSRLAVEVFAYSQTKEEQFVVTCGRAQDMMSEQERYEDTAPKDYAAAGTSMALSAETLHFAATAWTIFGGNLEETKTFTDFYQERPDRKIRSSLEHLFQTTLAPWHQGGRFVEENKSLAQLYRERSGFAIEALLPAEFERRMQALSTVATSSGLASITFPPDQLEIRFQNGEILVCPDPVRYLFDDALFPNFDALCGTIPGNTDVDNVLVDTSGETWLTDFAQAGTHPTWQDAVSLETGVRFKLLEVNDLFTLYEFEEQLLAIHYLSDVIAPGKVKSECKKALSAIQTIRHQAAELAGEDPLSYYTGLLFFTAQGLAFYDPEVRQTKKGTAVLLHRLLLTAILCKKIAQIKDTSTEDSPRQESTGIRIDKHNRQVWVNEKEVELTPTEFDLLLYLYHHAGQLCKRPDIVQDVFSYTDASPDDEKTLPNTPIYRLRQKIEPYPSHPRYILTVRKQGYKLVVQPD